MLTSWSCFLGLIPQKREILLLVSQNTVCYLALDAFCLSLSRGDQHEHHSSSMDHGYCGRYMSCAFLMHSPRPKALLYRGFDRAKMIGLVAFVNMHSCCSLSTHISPYMLSLSPFASGLHRTRTTVPISLSARSCRGLN